MSAETSTEQSEWHQRYRAYRGTIEILGEPNRRNHRLTLLLTRDSNPPKPPSFLDRDAYDTDFENQYIQVLGDTNPRDNALAIHAATKHIPVIIYGKLGIATKTVLGNSSEMHIMRLETISIAPDYIMGRIIELKTNPRKNITLDEFAKQFRISTRYARSCFKELNRIRIANGESPLPTWWTKHIRDLDERILQILQGKSPFLTDTTQLARIIYGPAVSEQTTENLRRYIEKHREKFNWPTKRERSQWLYRRIHELHEIGITDQDEIATMLGINQSTVSRALNGRKRRGQ